MIVLNAMARQSNGAETHDEAFDVLQSLNKNAEAFRGGDKQARDALVADCFRMVASLETPGEAFMRIMWTHVRSTTPGQLEANEYRPSTHP